MIVTRAPLRISIGGGSTDLPFYYSKFGGNLVSAGLDKYIYIIVEKREFYEEFLIRYSKTEMVKNVKDIKHTRIRAALEFLSITEPIEITSLADVPAGTGLGSSSSFLVALLKALHTYKKEDVSSKRLAEEAAHIEMEVLKEPIGKQDQYVASHGGLLSLEIEKNGNVIVSPLNISHETTSEIENNLLLFSTGISRSTRSPLLEQKKSCESEDSKMQQMHVIRDVGKEVKKTLEFGDPSKFGKWLSVDWEARRDITDKMSTKEIDDLYELGLRNGAIGGELVGAGAGGFLLFYCDNKKKQLRGAMANAGLKELHFKFDTDGCKILYNIR